MNTLRCEKFISQRDESVMEEESLPLLRVVGVSKRFGAVQALHRVSFELYHNEVLGLVGDNGAGKSTLIKIISGVYQPDEGEIFFEGKKVVIATPAYAKSLGIETVYQDLALALKKNVSENVFLGREYLKGFLSTPIRILDKRRMELETASFLRELRIDLNPRHRVENLSGGQRQATAIAKSIFWKAKLIIMDEPTAALGVSETARVRQMILDVKNHGVSVILISHNLEDIFSVADRAVVLRGGRKINECWINKTTRDELVKWMVAGEPCDEEGPEDRNKEGKDR